MKRTVDMRLARQREEKEREGKSADGESRLIYVCKIYQLFVLISNIVKYIYYINLETVDGKNHGDETS